MKPIINYIVDFLMFLFLIITTIAAYSKGKFHEPTAIILLVLVLIHLLLHWRWIVCMTKSLFKKS